MYDPSISPGDSIFTGSPISPPEFPFNPIGINSSRAHRPDSRDGRAKAAARRSARTRPPPAQAAAPRASFFLNKTPPDLQFDTIGRIENQIYKMKGFSIKQKGSDFLPF
jgi:hypothetical protein